MPEARDNGRACADAPDPNADPGGAADHTATKFRALAQLCEATGEIGRGGSRIIARQALGLLADLDLSPWELSEDADHLGLAKIGADMAALERPLADAVTVLRALKDGLQEPRRKSGGDTALLALVERFHAAEAAWQEKRRDRAGGHEATDELLALSEERRRLARAIAAVRSRTRVGAKAKASILSAFMDVGIDGRPTLRDERDMLIWSIGRDLGADAPRQPAEKA